MLAVIRWGYYKAETSLHCSKAVFSILPNLVESWSCHPKTNLKRWRPVHLRGISRLWRRRLSLLMRQLILTGPQAMKMSHPSVIWWKTWALYCPPWPGPQETVTASHTLYSALPATSSSQEKEGQAPQPMLAPPMMRAFPDMPDDVRAQVASACREHLHSSPWLTMIPSRMTRNPHIGTGERH